MALLLLLLLLLVLLVLVLLTPLFLQVSNCFCITSNTIYARESLFLGPYQHICVISGLYTHPIIIFYICIGPHAPGLFYSDARPRVRAPVVRPGARGPVRGDAVPGPVHFKNYEDTDVGNTLPSFNPLRPPGIHFGRPLLRNAMTRAVDFFPFLYSRYDKHYM